VKTIGIGYISIHACENNCILYWKGNVDLESCPKCKVSRWKLVRKSLDGKHTYKVPKKVLCYFPIKKCLQRLFLSSKTASQTRWHDEDRKKDGLLRHPADSPLWEDFNNKHPEFATDSRNIRLAFATDGFNPYRMQNVSYSIWPGICIPLNFPPSMCMKQSNFILSFLIPGKDAPGSDMNLYCEPLVNDLLDMFENGVRTYDASRGEYFQLRAAILWTITDFPGLGYVSGSVTSGLAACPLQIHLDLVMVPRLFIWVIEDSWMKITHLGSMPINLVVELSLGQHLYHLVGRKFWSALKILALVLARIHPERNPHARDPRKVNH
jgi:hypothetical protein